MCIINNKYLSAYLYYLIHIYSLIVMSFICIQNNFEGHEISVSTNVMYNCAQI